MTQTLNTDWVKLTKPLIIRIVPEDIKKTIEWVEVDVTDGTDGPATDTLYSTYNRDDKLPLTSAYVDIWVRANALSETVPVQIITPAWS